MPVVSLAVKKWGNNLGVRLPAAVARAARLREDQQVQISVESGAVVIRPATEDELSLDERLERFDPKRHGGEVMALEPLGAER